LKLLPTLTVGFVLSSSVFPEVGSLSPQPDEGFAKIEGGESSGLARMVVCVRPLMPELAIPTNPLMYLTKMVLRFGETASVRRNNVEQLSTPRKWKYSKGYW
jgi:hypothetical protein